MIGRRASGLLAVVAGVALLVGCGGSSSVSDFNLGRAGIGGLVPVPQRIAAPSLVGPTLTGSRLALSDLRGSVVVLNYWGSWCGPCRGEADALAQAASQTAPAGVRFLGLDTRDDESLARQFEAAHHIGYPSIVDADGSLQVRFRPLPANGSPPVTVLIDRRGRVAARFVGPVLLSELLPVVRRLAAEPA